MDKNALIYTDLYVKVNEMLAVLGAEGSINNDHETVEALMNTLYDIDEGVFRGDDRAKI